MFLYRRSQSSFLGPMRELNYIKKIQGYCYGIAHMGMQAILANDLDTFDSRILEIDAIPDDQTIPTMDEILLKRLSVIHEVKNKYKNYQLTDADKQVLATDPTVIRKISALKQTIAALINEGKLNSQFQASEFAQRKESLLYNAFLQKHIDSESNYFANKKAEIPAFFEGTRLYQKIRSHRELIEEERIPPQDCLAIAPLVLSTQLEAQGGIRKVANYSGIYYHEELTWVLESLQRAIRSNPLLKAPLAMVLSSRSHAITIGFDPEKEVWIAIDANELPSLKSTSPDALADWILDAFDDQCTCIPFSTEIYVTPSQEKIVSDCIANCIKEKTWQEIHNPAAKATLVNEKQESWLLLAARQGQTDVVKKLLDNNAPPNLAPIDSSYTPLLAATLTQSLPVIETLLLKNANPDCADEDGCSGLMDAVFVGNDEMLALLLAHTKSPNFQDINGNTALHYAASSKNQKAIQQLTAVQADMNITNNDGDTALFLAVDSNALACVNLLLGAGADPNLTKHSSRETPLHIAARKGNLEIVRALLAKGANPNLTNAEGVSPLMIAAEDGNLEIIGILLSAGADTEKQLNDGTAALHLAVGNDHFEIVKDLLDHHANVNATTHNNVTPVFLAAYDNNVHMVTLLCSKGADTFIPAKLDSVSLIGYTSTPCEKKAMIEWLQDNKPDENGLYDITAKEMSQILGYDLFGYDLIENYLTTHINQTNVSKPNLGNTSFSFFNAKPLPTPIENIPPSVENHPGCKKY